MTISDFANQLEPAGLHGYSSIRRLYRAQKRHDADVRQATFDVEVDQVAREQNVSETLARCVVIERKRFEHRVAARARGEQR